MTHGAKPVLNEQWQRKQSGQRKEERKRPRMNDGDNDEFSAAEARGGRVGGRRRTRRKCAFSLHVHVYLCNVQCKNVCKNDRSWLWDTEKCRGKKKIRGHGVKTGSQPNQFSLAESGCTISHQSTFFTLSALPSIHRGHPLCTLLRNKTDRKREKKHTLAHFHKSDPLLFCGKEAPQRLVKWHIKMHLPVFVHCVVSEDYGDDKVAELLWGGNMYCPEVDDLAAKYRCSPQLHICNTSPHTSMQRDFEGTGPQRPDLHPSPNTDKDRRRNHNFKNHKVTSGKLIRTSNPRGQAAAQDSQKSPQHSSAFSCMCHQGNSSNCAPSKLLSFMHRHIFFFLLSAPVMN